MHDINRGTDCGPWSSVEQMLNKTQHIHTHSHMGKQLMKKITSLGTGKFN